MRATAGALALCGLVACAEDPAGALDPEVVSALATEVGDARGVEPSGVYAVELTPETCGCSEIRPELWPLTLCRRGARGPVLDDFTLQTTLDLVASDGIIDLSSDAITGNPVGALDADGSFDAGAVTRLTSLAATGFQMSRVDGTVAPQGDSDYGIEGRVQMRLIGRVEVEGLDGLVTDIEGIDCVETLSFTGDRYIVR
ncbi:MAG: hypothetical protein ACE37F_18705 [Nannocystaceae bacterium]|nr:hypothetical protein [bacterium]